MTVAEIFDYLRPSTPMVDFACYRCARTFATSKELSAHARATRGLRATGRDNATCSDVRSDEAARQDALARIRLLATMGLMGRNP